MWCVTPIRSFPVKHILNTRHLRWGIIAACRQVTTSLGPSDCAFRLKKTRRLFGVVIAAVWDKFPAQVSMWARDIQGAKNHSTCSVQFCFFLFRLMFVISCSCSSAPRFPLLRNKCTNVLFFSYVLFLFVGGVKGSTGMRVVYLVQRDVSHVQYI